MPNPQTAPAPAEIEISYLAFPPGQTGPRPRRLTVHDTFLFKMVDSGTLTIEFKQHSPLANGQLSVAGGIANHFVAAVPGRFKFRCIRVDPGGNRMVLDPDDPNLPGGGGELEVVAPPV